jgi:hypothetical protein
MVLAVACVDAPGNRLVQSVRVAAAFVAVVRCRVAREVEGDVTVAAPVIAGISVAEFGNCLGGAPGTGFGLLRAGHGLREPPPTW